MRRLTTAMAALTGAAVLFFGLNFLLNPGGAAAAFGIEPWPQGNADGYFTVKAVRDLATGTTVFVLLALRQRRVLGWVMLVNAVIPAGDALAVLTHGGTVATALAVHASAAAAVVLTASLLLAETRTATHRAPAPVPQTA